MGGECRYYEMDFSELTRIIFSRVQKVEPENVVKIVGCIFLKEPSEQEMVQLAFGSDNVLLSEINDAKAMHNLFAPRNSSAQIESGADLQQRFNSFPPGSRSFSSPAAFHHISDPYWQPQLASDQRPPIHNLDFVHRPFVDSAGEDYPLRNLAHISGLEEHVDPVNHMSNYYYQDGGPPLRAARRTPSLPEFPIKTCHYFSRGYCKHGANCRYFHSQAIPDCCSHAFSQNLNDLANDDQGFLPGSLENLEMELKELLRSKKGMPVSIASLPMLYYEKYGKNLQADGYLTESQRHGKVGFSLTKLLARLKNSIRLIDRPHGQHSVILAEDAPRYMDYRVERSDPAAIVASSHQIYLTFPAESTFTEEDVSNYFKQYGSVRDVRIPCQDKRMFGFVSFNYADAVNSVLLKRNPHYICGARVLVKPYREKSRMPDRMYMEKIKPPLFHASHYLEMEPELHAMPRDLDSSRSLRKHLMEQEKMIEYERRRISEFNLVPKPLPQQPYFSYGGEEHKVEGPDDFPLDHFSYTLDILNNGSTSDDKARNANALSDNESNHIELPDSPFASPPVGSGISAVI